METGSIQTGEVQNVQTPQMFCLLWFPPSPKYNVDKVSQVPITRFGHFVPSAMGPKSINIVVGGKGYMSDAQKCLNILYITSNPVPCVSGFKRPTATHGLRLGAPQPTPESRLPDPRASKPCGRSNVSIWLRAEGAAAGWSPTGPKAFCDKWS